MAESEIPELRSAMNFGVGDIEEILHRVIDVVLDYGYEVDEVVITGYAI